MTKCNKILLCAMLAVVMTLACALAVLPVAHPTTANAEGTFTLVSSLNNGDSVVFVAGIANYELSGISTAKTKYGTGVKITNETPGGVYVLEVVKNDNGTYSFKNGNNYLSWTSGNSLITSSSISDTSSWDVSFSDGVAIIINHSTVGLSESSQRKLFWNNTSNSMRFAAYANKELSDTYQAIRVYKLASSTPVSNSALTLTETVSAVADSSEIKSIDGTDTLVLGAGSMFDVVYAIESATDIWAIEATAIAGKIGETDNTYLTVKSITAGDEIAAEANVSGETATTLKIASTGDMSKYVGKQLVTVRYQLNEGVTEVPTGAFGLEVKAVGKDAEYVAANKVTTTASTTPIKVVQTANITLKNDTVDYKAAQITVGTENADIIVDNGGHTGDMTATWVDSEGNALADQNVVNAGAYKLELAFAANGIYAAQEQTFDVTVNKAKLTNVNYFVKNGFGTKYIVNGASVTWNDVKEFDISFAGLKGSDTVENIGKLAITTPVTLDAAGDGSVVLSYTITSGNYEFENAQYATGTVAVSAKEGGIKIEGKPEVDTVYYGTTISFDTLKATNVTTGEQVDATFTLTIRTQIGGDIIATISGADVATYKLVNAGEYFVDIKAVAANETLGEAESANNKYTIKKVTLADITLDYKTDGKVTWSAPKYYTTDPADAKDLNTLTGVTANITYKVNDGEPFAATEYAPTATADSLTIAVLCDNANFNLPEAVITKAVVKVTFIDEKHTEEGTGTATQYRFVGQKATQPTPAPEFVGWTFAGWYLADETATFDFANRAVNESITLTAKWTENLVQCTITVINVYNGETDGTTGTTLGTTVEGKKPLNGVEELTTIALTKFVKVEGYYSDAACTLLITEVPNKATATIYAKYVLALGNGDINGDKTVDNNDIVLYRKYIVGGYDIEVIGIGDEYTAAVLYADDTETKFFFKAVANVNGDKTTEGEIQTDVYDIRDAAVLAMAMVNANGYGVSEDNTHITTPSDSTNASASTSTQAVQYALLPTGKYAA